MSDEGQSSLVKVLSIAGGTAGPSILAGYAIPKEGVLFPQAAFVVMAALVGLLFSAIITLYQQNLDSERRHREYLQDLLGQALGVGEQSAEIAKSVVDMHKVSARARRRGV